MAEPSDSRRATPMLLQAVVVAFLLLACDLAAQTEPPHPILTISGSGSGASTILSSWTEDQYTNNFVPRLGPRNDDYGFVPEVVPGDTSWSWSSSTPNQITSTPRITSFNLSVSNLILSGTNGVPGGTYYLLASTNIILPATNWTRLASNVFDGSGTFSITNAVDPNIRMRFYMLQIP